MALFHTHSWKVVSTDYTPPVSFSAHQIGVLKITGDFCDHYLMGTTHVYSKCCTCGKLKQQDFTGKFTPSRVEE